MINEWQLRPLENWMIQRHEDRTNRQSDFRDGVWWVWDMGTYLGDTISPLEPVNGQVYRIERKQIQIFKVLRVEHLVDPAYFIVQVSWDWYLKGGDGKS